MKQIFGLLRTGEWIDSKLFFHLFCVALVMVCSFEKTTGQLFWYAQGYLLFLATFLGSSYLINDLSDLEVDKKAGKKKLITQYQKGQIVLLLIIVMAIGLIPLCFLPSPGKTLILAAIIYFFGFSYSLPPLRFKEKGLIGTMLCSIAQKCLPLVLMIFWGMSEWKMWILMLLLNFFVGMRYILIHQTMDIQNDRKSGVTTFSSEHPKMAMKLLYANVAAELILLGCIFVALFIMATRWQVASFGILTAFYILLLLVFIRAVSYMLGERIFTTYSFVPFEDYYSIFLPLLVCVWMMVMSYYLWAIDVVLILLIQMKMMKVRGGFLMQYGRSLRQNRRSRQN